VLAERMQRIGDAFGVDAECDDWDLAWLGTFDLPAGCSAVFYPGRRHKARSCSAGQELRLPTLTPSESLGGTACPSDAAPPADPWIVELYPDQEYASITIGSWT